MKRPLLTETLAGRANSFDLIRLTACVLVLSFHGIVLSGKAETSHSVLDITFGLVGLLMLFGISGFLVTASWRSDERLRAYFVKRGLRIFPGLIVSVIVTALVIGPLVTTLSAGDYFSRFEPYGYVLRCSVLDTFNTHLPGVFNSNPFPDVVNGSLWSIPVEWCCYIAVAGAAMLRVLPRPWLLGTILAALFIAMAFGADQVDPNLPPDQLQHSVLLSLLPCGSFLAGVLIFTLRDHIRRNPAFLAAALVALVLPIPAGPHIALEMVAIPFAAIYLGLTRPGRLGFLVAPGDVSYGVYIYSYVISQTLASTFGGIEVLPMITVTLVLSWLVGLASWHLIEHPALGFKQRFSGSRGLAERPEHGEGPAKTAAATFPTG